MAENYVLLETIELTQNAASIVFDNIPQTGYTDLKIVMSARSNRVASGSGATMTFNGVSTGYSYRQLYGFSGGVGSVGGSSTGISFNITAANFTANSFESIEFYIPNYTANTNKSISIDAVRSDTASAWQLDMFAYLWSNSAAISTITIDENNSSTFVAGCTFSLYGVAAVGTTPTVAPKATGGNMVSTDGTYWYHTFLTSGTFTPQTNLTCDYLVVAGGGAGGGGPNTNADGCGGGGAGGYRTANNLSVTSNTFYAVTIGAGAAGTTTRGATGSNSSFAGTVSSGGGGGATQGLPTGTSGGSGGGSTSSGGAGGAGNAGGYSPVEGYAGGASGGFTGAGGGGAGAIGANGSGSNVAGGAGGAGVASSISGTSVTYAGGGGGAGYNGGGGSGGSGGGGAGGNYQQAGNPGAANTGGGGGGANNHSAPRNGGNGGSGVVVIRYLVA